MPKKQYRFDKPEGCDIKECIRPHHSNGLCVAHWQRRQEYGDPLAGPPLRKPRSDIGKPRQYVPGRNKTDEYHVNHKNVRTRRGPAWQQVCAHCGAQAAQWATIKGANGESPDDFVPLCMRCHALYDDFASRLARPSGETHHSARLTERQVREIVVRASEDRTALAHEFGVSNTVIYLIHAGKTWKAVTGGEPVIPIRHYRAELTVDAGQRFGRLLVTGLVTTIEAAGRRHKVVQCTCDCGATADVRVANLLTGNTKSCGCLQKEAGRGNYKLIVETGQRFGRGVVLDPDLRVNGRRSARLRCDCGREYVTVIYAMLNGATVSCGCRGRETRIGSSERGDDDSRVRENVA